MAPNLAAPPRPRVAALVPRRTLVHGPAARDHGPEVVQAAQGAAARAHGRRFGRRGRQRSRGRERVRLARHRSRALAGQGRAAVEPLHGGLRGGRLRRGVQRGGDDGDDCAAQASTHGDALEPSARLARAPVCTCASFTTAPLATHPEEDSYLPPLTV
ncbi:hypothetical protein M885DRAFT_517359 [Pelagophyceae sp. CCMP2097]|nr:hypothetical protein M885DRAFT_517359 [Pelagophyceae sp. CCMP2097]